MFSICANTEMSQFACGVQQAKAAFWEGCRGDWGGLCQLQIQRKNPVNIGCWNKLRFQLLWNPPKWTVA